MLSVSACSVLCVFVLLHYRGPAHRFKPAAWAVDIGDLGCFDTVMRWTLNLDKIYPTMCTSWAQHLVKDP